MYHPNPTTADSLTFLLMSYLMFDTAQMGVGIQVLPSQSFFNPAAASCQLLPDFFLHLKILLCFNAQWIDTGMKHRKSPKIKALFV